MKDFGTHLHLIVNAIGGLYVFICGIKSAEVQCFNPIFLSMCHHRFADTTQISRWHFFFIRRWRTRKINRKTNTHIPSLKNAARTKVINCCTIFYHLHPTSETLFASSIQKRWCLPTITSLLQLPKHSKSFPTRTRTTISSSKAPVPLFISGCWMYKTEVENHPNNIIEIHNNVFCGIDNIQRNILGNSPTFSLNVRNIV